MSEAVLKEKIRHWVDLGETRKGQNVFSDKPSGYRVCKQCVMDTSDAEITFDQDGICNYCHDYKLSVKNQMYQGEAGQKKLQEIVETIKAEGRGKPYDCILGLSGGVDSTYVAYLCKKIYGLRPLAVHLDNGWNSEIAVRNIENIVSILGIDLYTEVLNWDEFRALQVSFLKSSTPDSEIPTDHAIVATLYNQAIKNGIRWIMDGSNVATEITLPSTWSHGHADWKYIKSVHRLFGNGMRLKSYPHYNYFQFLIGYPRLRKLMKFPILNYIDYNKLEAMDVLKKELSWEPYGGKHYESIYTRFYQGYILPAKFGFDKRRAHLSCLVNNGRISREEALRQLQSPAIDDAMRDEDRVFVVKKLGLTEPEFNEIMNAPKKTFWDYPSYEKDIRHVPFWLLSLATKMFVRSSKTVPAGIMKRLGQWGAES